MFEIYRCNFSKFIRVSETHSALWQECFDIYMDSFNKIVEQTVRLEYCRHIGKRTAGGGQQQSLHMSPLYWVASMATTVLACSKDEPQISEKSTHTYNTKSHSSVASIWYIHRSIWPNSLSSQLHSERKRTPDSEFTLTIKECWFVLCPHLCMLFQTNWCKNTNPDKTWWVNEVCFVNVKPQVDFTHALLRRPL